MLHFTKKKEKRIVEYHACASTYQITMAMLLENKLVIAHQYPNDGLGATLTLFAFKVHESCWETV